MTGDDSGRAATADTAWDADAVRTGVAALAAADPGHLRFGAEHHGYRLRPRLREDEVRLFEQRYGVRLPDSYRGFVRAVADGGAGPDYGVLGLTEEIDEEEALFDLREESLADGALAAPFPYSGARPGPGKGGRGAYRAPGSLVIGDLGCNTVWRLVVAGRFAGQVWLDDPDWGGLTPGPDFRDWYGRWLGGVGGASA